ncbi:GAF domain-containing protein [Ornithinimicrobium faecis]|uniref:GAF domain-containing protein n=1 Tax=Ornithinimicrobium faecis TaxID=2934158 RepID=A0ABY4YQX3_9MICO|nr:GAF domain-containing protein [Ornithinimicrobium sp. HY1793]USQ79118.1 GAF domain-containing protein [Ornithinimicrobium sp. HY1793]
MAMDPAARIYWADGAGSRAVFTSLQAVLQELRTPFLGDRAVALYRPTGMSPSHGYFVLSDSCDVEGPAAMGNERLVLNQRLDLDQPRTVSGLSATSTLRPFTLVLDSAVSIPWQDPYGRGVALIGVQDANSAMPDLSDQLHRAEIGRLVETLNASRLQGTLALQRNLGDAVRAVLDSGPTGVGRMGRLTSLVASAREIFGSDTAYLALPEESETTKYYFASMANVNTPQFRQLRMRFEQGLGGLARSEGKVVRTLRYADDDRLKAPPVSETLVEGISSAMAAPLFSGGAVRGVIYIGNRTPTPFSETDERVLEEFAEYLGLLMGEPHYQDAVRESQSTRLREDFAHAIHDSVVRSLVQIGFTAEQASASAQHEATSQSIAQIQVAAEEALTTLREELSGLILHPSTGVTELGAVVEQITDVPLRPGAERNIYLSPVIEHETLPHNVAEVLVQVGVEALTNSLRHAAAQTERVEIISGPDTVELLISDDGHGSAQLQGALEGLVRGGHFGLSSMFRRASSVNGHLDVTSSPDAGTTVHLRVPRTW